MRKVAERPVTVSWSRVEARATVLKSKSKGALPSIGRHSVTGLLCMGFGNKDAHTVTICKVDQSGDAP